MSDQVLLAIQDGVATVTLNRPEKLNAFAGDMRERLGDALERVAAEATARVLVLTGAGRAFCAGGDVGHLAGLKEEDAPFEAVERLLDAADRVLLALERLPIPTLAMVNGVAAGAGLNLALACDLRIASDQAAFAESFVRLGLHPDWGGTYHLPRLVGAPKALEMCWTGEPLDAAEALRIGLVNRVVAHGKLADEAGALADRLAQAPVASVRLIKRTLRASGSLSLRECLDAEREAQAVCWGSPDSAEGVRAFIAKRETRFRGAPVTRERPASRFE